MSLPECKPLPSESALEQGFAGILVLSDVRLGAHFFSEHSIFVGAIHWRHAGHNAAFLTSVPDLNGAPLTTGILALDQSASAVS